MLSTPFTYWHINLLFCVPWTSSHFGYPARPFQTRMMAHVPGNLPGISCVSCFQTSLCEFALLSIAPFHAIGIPDVFTINTHISSRILSILFCADCASFRISALLLYARYSVWSIFSKSITQTISSRLMPL